MVDQLSRNGNLTSQHTLRIRKRDKSASGFGDPKLGVLFVHGLGHQKRGETVPWAGEAVFEWLQRWLCSGPGNEIRANCSVYLADTRLKTSIPSEKDAPPFGRLRFKGAGVPTQKPALPRRPAGYQVRRVPKPHHWVLAESWWAEEFTPPSFRETIPLSLAVAPVVLEQITGQVIRNSLQVVRDAGRRPHPIDPSDGIWARLRYVGWRFIDAFWIVYTWIIEQGMKLLIFLLGSFVQLLLVALVVLGLVPFLSGFVSKLQLHLAGWLGDAYLMAVSPVRFSAMVSKVRRDIAWLDSKLDNPGGCCKSIAVVAHSGGAVVSHAAVTGAEAPILDEPILLITYGSGQEKVDLMSQYHRRQPAFLIVSPYLRIVSAVCFLIALVLSVQPNPNLDTILWFGLGGGLGIQGALYLARLMPFVFPRPVSYRPPQPVGKQWVDYIAVSDIVPGEHIHAARRKPVATVARPESTLPTQPASPQHQGIIVSDRVDNLHSAMQDHGSYWSATEGFVTNVARLLYAKANGTLPTVQPGDKIRFKMAAWRRQRRALRLLAVSLLLILCAPALWYGLEPWLHLSIGKPIRTFAVSLLPGQVQTVTGTGPIEVWQTLVGLAALIGTLFLFHSLVVHGIWRFWTKIGEDALFARRSAEPSNIGLKIAFAAITVAVPIFTVWLVARRFFTYDPLDPRWAFLKQQGWNGLDLATLSPWLSDLGENWLRILVYAATILVIYWFLILAPVVALVTSIISARAIFTDMPHNTIRPETKVTDRVLARILRRHRRQKDRRRDQRRSPNVVKPQQTFENRRRKSLAGSLVPLVTALLKSLLIVRRNTTRKK
jgi:hypothetical protein